MYCISVSHKKTPADIREQFAFRQEEQIAFLDKLKAYDGIGGCVILSTCNRTELYFTNCKAAVQEDLLSVMQRKLTEYKNIPEELLLEYCMVYDGKKAIRHLYRVCCGMDSMVLGEVEILHQAKQAYLLAAGQQAVDTELNMIFQGAFHNAKAVTNHTRITRLPVSIGTLTARAVIDFCREQENTFHILVVGARGKIGNIVVRDLADFGVEQIEIIGTSRNHKAANAEFSGVEHVTFIPYDERYQAVKWADVIISATSSPHYTFTAKRVEECLENDGKKRLCIDLAVPRDFDTTIGNLPECDLLDIDHFKELAADNNIAKVSELQKAEWMLEEKVDEVSKAVLFQEFRREHGKALEQLSEKNASWLLYRLRDTLQSKEFDQILEMIASELED